ncbi:toxin TcdB middle/N-terminal domain-containing protein [Pseudoalteromonas sp. Of7M-16]|uniref:toxin TcdB middle/N-terminal domain-containing protein n=1 Tax=Pseudoalteromonas sp. Of7M-16 TaxID=2917756 RepID=UPI001EF5356A|nr:toxin TcdB middle/N-terminal domain-containing protein [Pseudoalteromonas sp. Of7M-16]MCG7547060.1 FG-GAP-like repeat-containing protein [Pseudoalteromonas sp. Of7M-16]
MKRFNKLAFVSLSLVSTCFSAWAIDNSAIQQTHINLPQGPGKQFGLGELYSISGNQGSGGFKLPIGLPTGRGGLTPELSIDYNAGFGNGLVGIGHQLSIPSIRHQTDKGLPDYQASSSRFVLSDGSELVHLGEQRYQAKLSGDPSIYELTNDGWRVTLPDGSQWQFGTSVQSRTQGDGKTFAWHLDKISDTSGNTIDIDYQSLDSSATVYPTRLRYSANEVQVSLDYERREDAVVNYKPGFALIMNYRLKRISTQVQSSAVSHYELNYHPSTDWHPQSRLKSFTTLSGDRQLSQPTISFEYGEYPGSYQVQSLESAKSLPFWNDNAGFVDLNSDGLVDVINTGVRRHAYWINQGTDQTGKPVWDNYKNMTITSGYRLTDDSVHLADMNGDGKTDLLIGRQRDTLVQELDEANNWQTSFSLNGLYYQLNNSNTILIDINNDKRTDVLYAHSSRGRVLSHIAQLNLEDGWSEPKTLPLHSHASGYEFGDNNIRFADMNGDGLPDLVAIVNAGVRYFPNRGLGGFGEPVAFTNSPRLFNLDNVQLIDMNADGKADLVHAAGMRASIWLNKGISTQNASSAAFTNSYDVDSPTTARNISVDLADMNGNGSTDIVWQLSSGAVNTVYFVDLFSEQPANILTKVDNGMGLTTELQYQSIAQYMYQAKQAGKAWQSSSPISMPVVSAISTRDSVSGTVSQQVFNYQDSYYYAPDKAFRGFKQITTTLPESTNQTAQESIALFDVGDVHEVLSGNMTELVRQDKHGVFDSQHFTFEPRTWRQGGAGDERSVQFAAMVASTQTRQEKGSGAAVTVSEKFDYDAFGNVIYIEQSGRQDGQWQDARIIYNEYSAQLGAAVHKGMVNLPTQTVITDALGNVVSKKQWFYDDESFSAQQGALSRGLMTQARQWFNTQSPNGYIDTVRQKHNQYGQVSNVYGPLWGRQPGHETKLSYDASLNTYVTQIDLNTGTDTLTATAEYDLSLGVITGYQHYDKQRSVFEYDALGRLTKVIKPGDSTLSPSSEFSYHIGSGAHNWVHARHKAGSTQYHNSYTYLDGYSRRLMVRSDSERSGQVVVSDRVQYNGRGSIVANYLPYFATGYDYQLESKSANEQFHYDALGRVIKLTHNFKNGQGVNAYATVTYTPFAELHLDAEQTDPTSAHFGVATRLTFDAFNGQQGRLRQVDETVAVSADGQLSSLNSWQTRYNYDLQGNLTQYIDPQNNVRSMVYDQAGRLTYVNDPNRGQKWYAYQADTLLATLDARGLPVAYQVDGLGRQVASYHLAKQALPHASDWAPSIDFSKLSAHTQYAYYGSTEASSGRLKSIIHPFGSQTHSYTARGQVAQLNKSIKLPSGQTSQYQMGYEYDAANRLSAFTYPDNTRLTYQYNVRSLIQSVSGVAGSIEYNAAGMPQQYQLNNGVLGTYQYDDALRLTQLQSEKDGLTYQKMGYHHDSAGNITQIDDLRDSQSLAKIAEHLGVSSTMMSGLNTSANFIYDDWYRLINGQVGGVSYDYRYDLIGNRVSASTQSIQSAKSLIGLMQGGEQTTYMYGGGTHAQTAWHRNGRAATEAGGPNALTHLTVQGKASSLSYDPVGNRLTDGATRYAWDRENRLTSVSADKGQLEFGYDHANLRLFKYSKAADGLTNTVVYVDRDIEFRHGQLYKYVTLNGKRIALSRQSSGAYQSEQYYLTNHLASTELSLDTSGRVTSAINYDPYGNQTVSLGNDAITPYRFTGKEFDEISGLGYFEQRYLSSVHGQFISPDPIFALPNRFVQPQLFSTYSYSRNNPQSYIDPDGQFAIALAPLVPPAIAAISKTVTAAVGKIAVGKTLGYVGAATLAGYAGSEAINAYKESNNQVDEDVSNEDGEYTNLADEEATKHILDGDELGGGHGPGRNTPGKSEFPSDWTDEEVMEVISDVATAPSSVVPAREGRWKYRGKRKGIKIEVIIGNEQENGKIITAYPNDKKIPKNPPREQNK